jgi:hypothetical protein
MHILQGETLLNDASGLVCMRFAVVAVLTGTFSLIDAFGTFDGFAPRSNRCLLSKMFAMR